MVVLTAIVSPLLQVVDPTAGMESVYPPIRRSFLVLRRNRDQYGVQSYRFTGSYFRRDTGELRDISLLR